MKSSSLYPFQEQWEDYRMITFSPVLMFPILIVSVILSLIVGSIVNKTVGGIVLAFGATLAVGLGIWMALLIISWKCPNCGNRFSPNRTNRRSCDSCGLPRYYGSTFLEQKWGKEGAVKVRHKWEARMTVSEKV
jgi:hypothetical protein